MNQTTHFYLILSEGGSVRTTIKRPKLNENEISVGVTLEFPRDLFKKPQLNARLTISDDAVSRPEITSAVMDGMKQAIEEGTGMKVSLSIAPEAEGGESSP